MSQASQDAAFFSAPPPDVQADRAKAKEKEERGQKVTPEQIKVAEKLSDSMKSQKDAEEKAMLIRQLLDYIKLMKEYHPERVEYLRVPKTFGVKNTVEELRIWIDDIKSELGKKSGIDHVTMLWVEGFQLFERFNANQRFGINVDGLGKAALNSVTPRRLEDGSVIHGPAIPTLAEFATEHSNWFQSSVNYRTALMAVQLVAGVHRLNTQVNVAKASETPVSKESADLMKKI